jgi:O-antigen/teichoic acid export membrane protein
MRRVWHRATQLLGLAVIPIFVLAEVLAPDIIVLLFGESYITAVPILRIYLLILPLSIFLGSPMLRATGDLGVMVAGDTLALVMSIVALLLLVEPLGTLGAVTSLVIGRSVFMGVAALQTARRLELSVGTFFPWQALLGILVASLIAVASGAIVAGYLSLPLLARLMTAGAISGGLYAVIAWWSSLIPETEKQMARSFWDRFRSSWPNRGRR